MRKIVFVILFAACISGCGNKKAAEQKSLKIVNATVNQVVGIGKIEPENDIINLASEISGIVQKVYVKENDTVKAGEVILELKHSIEDADVAQNKSLVATQFAQVGADKAAINEYQIRYHNSATELTRLQDLLAKGAETRQTVDNASTEMQAFGATIARLQAVVEVSEQKLSDSKAQLEVSVQKLKQKFIKAPVNAVVLEMSLLPGNAVVGGQGFAQLSPEGRTIAVCEIDELFADKIVDGQKAWIRNFGSLDKLSTGTVYFTSSFLKKKSLFTDQSGEKEDRRVREIRIMLDQPKKLLINSQVECVVVISDTAK